MLFQKRQFTFKESKEVGEEEEKAGTLRKMNIKHVRFKTTKFIQKHTDTLRILKEQKITKKFYFS